MNDEKKVSEMDAGCMTVGDLRNVLYNLDDEVLVNINGSPTVGMYSVTDYDRTGTALRTVLNLFDAGGADRI